MEFLNEIFLNNTIRSYLAVLGTILIVLLFKQLLSRYIAVFLFMFIHKAWKTIEKKQFNRLVVKPLGWLLVVMVAVFALYKLNFPDVLHFKIYGVSSEIIFEKLGSLLIILSFIRLILSLINFIALILIEKAVISKDKNDNQLVVFFRDFLKAIFFIIGGLMILKVGFNQDLGTLLTGLSIIGAALALAAKESLENLIASFIILMDKPFHIGDTLKVNNVTGTVERIGLRSTRIRTSDKTLVTVPNKQMVDSIVDNFSMRNERRAEMKVEFSLETSMSEIEKFIERTKAAMDKSKEIVKYSAFISEMNKTGFIINIEYYTVPFSLAEFNKLKQSLIISNKKIIEELEVKTAAPGADIHIHSNTEPVPPAPNPII